MELSKTFSVISHLQHALSSCCIVWALQFVCILLLQLLICFHPEGCFVGDDHLDYYLDVICEDILHFIFSHPNHRNY